MEKFADTDYPVHQLIQRRWSPRAFSDDPVDDNQLCRILEAARWAPSCYNDQPWNFIVAKQENQEEYEAMLDCLVEGNQTWAKQAPVLMISVARLQFDHNGGDNRHALHDVGLAAENLVLQALDQGLYVHQMAGIHLDTIRDTYDIPEDHEPVAGFAIGYPGDPKDLPEDLRERETQRRTRQTLDEFVHSGSWGTTSPVVQT
ncbi:MAG: nitroreductase family protein [bacterium]